MSPQHWSYVAMLTFCLAGVLPLIAVFHLRVLRQPRRLFLSILAGGVPFLVWDVLATAAGHWRFDASQTLSWRAAGLPLEEFAFFAVIPLASIVTYESVQAICTRDRAQPARRHQEVR